MQIYSLAQRLRQMAKSMYYRIYNVGQSSWSQCGEDRILDYLACVILKMSNPTYLDIGAHQPWYLSNTALFYSKGSRGFLVEPDANLAHKLRTERPGDSVFEFGVGPQSGQFEFFVMSEPTLNTMDKNEAQRIESMGVSIISNTQIRVVGINELLGELKLQDWPDILSLDVEGLDEQIVTAADFVQSGPKLICLETVSYDPISGKKDLKLSEIMNAKGYLQVADTWINSIFVRKELWQQQSPGN
ncbi:MAG: FkbM family methyltransferase [Candidatus Cloacimonetes bacterium]|nr:FkbM family methyltransferase [Candidatus Cloacimonadota bacterium]